MVASGLLLPFQVAARARQRGKASGTRVRWVVGTCPPETWLSRPCVGAGAPGTRRAVCPGPSVPPPFSQLVYMGFDAAAAEAALRVFRGNVQLAAQTLAHNGGSLPPDLQLSAEDSSATPPTSPSDSAGGSAVSEDRLGGSVCSGGSRQAGRAPPGGACASRGHEGHSQTCTPRAARALWREGPVGADVRPFGPRGGFSFCPPPSAPLLLHFFTAGTSSASTDEDMETEAVNEILEDIPEHEEDYLDSTLEDEEIIIAEYLSYVENIKSATKRN